MSDPFESQRLKYKHTVVAEVLFFNNKIWGRALRLEALTIGLEFSDNVYIGTDPEGILSYNDIQSFRVNNVNQPANYYIDTIPYNKKTVLHIKFYHEDINRPFAEFLAEDPTDAAGRNQMIGFGNKGLWNKLTLGSATATVYKDSDSNTVTLSVPAIHKEAVFCVSGSVANASLDVHGTIFYKDINSIPNGLVVNYSSDRLVFYKDVHQTDFTSYFIPFEDGGSGGQTLQLDCETEFSGIKWCNV